MAVPVSTPPCYGILYDIRTEACQACLVNCDCKEALKRPKAAVGEDPNIDDLNDDKKLLILAVCQKYGIPTQYFSKTDKTMIQATPENKVQFHNLDFLLCNITALKVLLSAELVQDRQE